MAIITLQGDEIHTEGNIPAVGEQAPDFVLVNQELEDKSLKDFTKKKLISIVPSLDTPVCTLSTKNFDTLAADLEDTDILIVSADLPFAMARFANAEDLESVTLLSTIRSKDFAQNYGVLIADGPLAGITARAVVVLDKNNIVKHAQLVPEISSEPDYDAATKALE